MSLFEVIGATLGLLNQWLTIRQHIACWPVGIASVAAYAFVFYDARLYSDMLLQGIYLVLQAYGWNHWLRGGSQPLRDSTQRILPVSRLSVRGGAILATMIVVSTATLGTLMGHYTRADLPYWDAAPTVMSLAAQYLQARKVLESWLLFIMANVVFIGVYAAKGLYVTIGLFIVLTVLAGWGFARWRTAYRASGAR